MGVLEQGQADGCEEPNNDETEAKTAIDRFSKAKGKRVRPASMLVMHSVATQ